MFSREISDNLLLILYNYGMIVIKNPVIIFDPAFVFMFTRIFSITYLAQTCLAAIVIINGLEAVVVQPGWAQTYVLSQEPSTTEATEELIINGTLNENSELFEDDGSYFQKHTFTGKAGEAITIELSSSEFDAYLMLADPKFNKIAENDDGGENNNAKIKITLFIRTYPKYLYCVYNVYVVYIRNN
ncbi:MAG: PPC domain-containing protein, partial [Trichodesmium sp. St11_bin5]|nr:PPC domain-containing protein [Trichodesmium sp. St11_bin5]